MSKAQQNAGVHTYAVGMTLTAAQYYKIKDSLGAFLRKNDGNYWSRAEHYTVDVFRKQGVWLYLSRMDVIYRVKVRIEPCRVLGSGDPTALYQPDKKSYRMMVDSVDKLLKTYHVPRSVDNMKISRMDLTCDLVFRDAGLVLQYIRILQKSFVLPHYKRVFFREKDGKAKNTKTANQHSCRQQCKQAAFFAYDKTAQLQMIGRLPKKQLDKRVLRLEAELNRGAIKQHLGKRKSNYQFLKQGVKRGSKVIDWYLKRIYKDNKGPHLRYEDAVTCVAEQHWKDKTKERAAYLLRKVSDSESLNAAIRKTAEKFGIKRQTAMGLVKKLEQAGVNPVTLTNACGYGRMENLRSVLKSAAFLSQE